MTTSIINRSPTETSWSRTEEEKEFFLLLLLLNSKRSWLQKAPSSHGARAVAQQKKKPGYYPFVRTSELDE
jgi:hypothetical protein